MKSTKSLQPDVKELVLCQNDDCACETYVFEPAPNETSLGYLLVAAETKNNEQQGQQLLDNVIAAVQKEYYRDPARSALSSFESALRQANLILTELTESNQRQWMQYFNVALAVLEKSTLHVSVAGEGVVFIGRNRAISDISIDLAQFPIIDPLNTFSQVASGAVMPGDTIWLGSSELPKIFTANDLTRLSLSNSASKIAQQMQIQYRDQQKNNPLAANIISILPNYVSVPPKNTFPSMTKRSPATLSPEQIKPRIPLEIKKSNFKNLILAAAGFVATGWQKLWPLLKKGSIQSKDTFFKMSRKTQQGVSSITEKGKSLSAIKKLPSRIDLSQTKSWPKVLWGKIISFFNSMPPTSKIFAIITIILAILLITSLLLLQKKRTTDETIQKASEILHQAETKKDAADMALIYNNREQARIMLSDAEILLAQLGELNLYNERKEELTREIQAQYDRLQKITRPDAAATTEVGDFGNIITQKKPTHLFRVGNNLYTFNPENNAIVKMTPEGEVKTVSSNTQGIDFFTTGIAHEADKSIILTSSTGSMAIFDTANETLRKQDVNFSSIDANIQSISVFGTRLYAYDKSDENIFSLMKTLRGYSNSGPWITAESFDKDNIRSIAVDGNIFTLHENGVIRRLFKGEVAEFQIEVVEPDLSGATRLITAENMRHIYVVDPKNQRVVIYNKTGALVRQIMLDNASQITDIAIGEREKVLYVLDNTKVLNISLEE